MKGLLRNSFYGTISGAIVSLGVFVGAGIVMLILGNYLLFLIFGLLCIVVFTFNAIASFRREISSNWVKYAITAPIKRRDVVRNQYINHMLWILAGTIVTAIFVGLIVLIHSFFIFESGPRDLLLLFCVGVGISLLIGSIFYPVICLVGTDKSEITMILSLVGGIGITAGIIWSINFYYGFEPINDAQYLIGMLIYVGIVIVLFALSYFLTKHLNQSKEY